MAERFWTCQRHSDGVRCAHVNPKRKHLCEACGKRRPATKKPAHMKALELPYEAYVIANGGSENCGICDRPPPPGKKHRRDHEHVGDGMPRGLLCWTCNLNLRGFATITWLKAAIAYLERAEQRRGLNLEALLQRGDQ
jgi:hypothetical protein